MSGYYEVSEYTAEDFEKASFARHPGIGATACRMAGAKGGPAWTTDDLSETTDEVMAASGWVPVVEARITLDGLEAAWEAAEEAAECRKGDVLIRQSEHAGYAVYPAAFDGPLLFSRILSRAPKREPWEDLADVLGDFAIHDHDGKEYPDVLAQRLYERGVRVTGGDEK